MVNSVYTNKTRVMMNDFYVIVTVMILTLIRFINFLNRERHSAVQ